ncbi:guanine deaminase [Eikenella sp. NML96-A-049]|uniref:guanine deaminase n=1 Tax=unclassified Eikenella TaxID=2639367 RepID=UPI0007DE7D95|nr:MULTISPECIES: guanine deaminase [unclassified Eikenella]OAM33746.1 guanine deaminase [Eikenella sp. NML070372]OAM41698.1 guanine deaminase [Eikenella sp. NML96-A-049]VDG99608.1 Guanine deaminase [Helicobacter pametensis]
MKTAIRSAMLTFKKDPFFHEMDECLVYESDAVIVMEGGKITQVGRAQDILPELDGVEVKRYTDSVIIPGFIDSHVHYPQTEIIGAYGEQLLDWLNNYTFIAEQGFKNKEHASEVAKVFLKEQFRNGVTSSTVYCTVFPQSVDAIFEEAEKYDMRIMAGKVCMDRNAPEALLDTPQRAYDESSSLIKKWHNKGRAEYVITPRFVPTSTPEQMEMMQALAAENPDMLIQSHVSENVNEVAWVKDLCPKAKDYTDAYAQYGLVRPRAIYGHGIHLTDRELSVFSETGAAVAHCPTSNFFLGSGCLNVKKLRDKNRPVHVGLATDLGAGTSFSMLQTMNEAYKAAQMNGTPYTSLHSFYLASRGTAEALGLQDKIGTIAVGMEADLTVLNLKSTPIIDYRMKYAKDLEEALFIQMTLGDDRAIAATYVAGKEVYRAN